MSGFRLNGWQRIGVVLSVLWAIGAVLYMEAAASRKAQQASVFYRELCIRNKSDRNDFDFQPCYAEAGNIYQIERRKWSAWALPVALVPIPIVWIVVYAVLGLVRWVRRGFQPAR